ncbi:MAG: hypothetical protein JSW11_20365 [Candidatus Heimdallarchaeota archaeon]|nr:MAG: hypothetical protein JSW11_20365 [Candidatus Heimdallarchaeota archaeon]
MTIADSELDLREANVTGVTFEQIDSVTYRFNVTLFHDDDGEAGYADFWVIETLNGTELGRRILTHPHGTQEFSRSGLIMIPGGIDIVVVRGHDQIHGFGGRAIIINIRTDEFEVVDQGSELMDFSDKTRIIPSTSTPNDKRSSGFQIFFSILVLKALSYRKREKIGDRSNNGS